MFLEKTPLYYNTLKYVKPTQLYHQVYYRVKNRFINKSYTGIPQQVSQLKFEQGIVYPNTFLGQNTFSFLNLTNQFSYIDWNFCQYGKLWTYNLNYFEFLHQGEMSKVEGLRLIHEFISSGDIIKDGLEPYPLSLRGINWIKFLSDNKIQNKEINVFLYRDYQRLVDNLEYHLLANHLLENGFSLIFGAYYFKDDRLYVKGKNILIKELKEQVLEDGAHYELSPMYHQIILHRILDSINLVQHNSWKERELLSLLMEKAEVMIGWLNEISFSNGYIPKLNDAANGISPSTKELIRYAERLGLMSRKLKLSDSGYRKFSNQYFEIIADVGQIAPSYQPGHSHADSLQFVLNYKEKPVIVDTGISTYEKNDRRQLERSTAAHNTVCINQQNSSNVWGGFRVAERAKVIISSENKTSVKAHHEGYKNLGVIHSRSFDLSSGAFKISDVIESKSDDLNVEGYLHFHPDTNISLLGSVLQIDQQLQIEFSGSDHLEIQEYQYAEGFNNLVSAKKIIYKFQNKTEFIIKPLVLDTVSTSAGKKNHSS